MRTAWASCSALRTLLRSAWAASNFACFSLRALRYMAVFDLRWRRFVVQGLLQSLLLGAFWRSKRRSSAGLAGTARTATRSAGTAWTTHPHTAHVGLTSRFHHFLHQRLNRGPLGVIGDVQALLDMFEHALSELGRVEVAWRSVVAGTSRAARITGAASVIVLREQISAAQPQGGEYSQDS